MLPGVAVKASSRASLGMAAGLVKGLTTPAGHLRIMCPAGSEELLIPAVDRVESHLTATEEQLPAWFKGSLDVCLNEQADF